MSDIEDRINESEPMTDVRLTNAYLRCMGAICHQASRISEGYDPNGMTAAMKAWVDRAVNNQKFNLWRLGQDDVAEALEEILDALESSRLPPWHVRDDTNRVWRLEPINQHVRERRHGKGWEMATPSEVWMNGRYPWVLVPVDEASG